MYFIKPKNENFLFPTVESEIKASGKGKVFSTAKFIFEDKRCMDGTTEHKYHVNLIRLLDKVFVTGEMRFLSIEQESEMLEFIEEAGIVTDKLNSINDEYIIKNKFEKFDNFLGNYLGENVNEYADW